jgi:signal transduction histidine kinase/ActR/RegA family two-component response regulator
VNPPQSPPPAPAPPNVDDQASAELLRLVFERSRPSNLLGIPVGALICWVLWGSVSTAALAAWFFAKVGVSLWRSWITASFDRAHPEDAPRWGRRYEQAVFADGVVFGLLGTAMLPSHDPALEAIMVATLLGIAAVGLVIHAVSLRLSLALTLPLLVPPMIHQFMHATTLSAYVGLGMAIFIGLVVTEGRKASRHTMEMLRLRYQMDGLTAQLRHALDVARYSSLVKTRFLATMSHEMRTPLHGILGLAQLLRRDDGAGRTPERDARFETLQATGEHLLGVINDVLDYARIEGGHLRVMVQPFDLAELLASIEKLTRVGTQDKGLSLQVDAAIASPCWVSGDAARLRQVLMNLTGNAVKFTERGGVTVALRRDAAGLTTIDVADTGPGVPFDQRESIFEAFVQADGSFTRRHGGTGLGLTISRELMRAMGGEIRCLEAPGGGALFRVELALPAAQAPAADASATGQVIPLRGHVLVVEDNAVNATVAEAMLRRLGVEVTIVADGEAAVSALRRAPFDLVLMDWQMPGVDGFEATARIRNIERLQGRPPGRIVALTANALDGDRERSLAAGMDDHLPKPFSEDSLRELLQRHLAA